METEKRLIDADAVLAEIEAFVNPLPNKSGHDFLCGLATAITEIEEAPTVDAVEVIRCKNCEYCLDRGSYLRCVRFGFSHGHEVVPDDFCSRGKEVIL